MGDLVFVFFPPNFFVAQLAKFFFLEFDKISADFLLAARVPLSSPKQSSQTLHCLPIFGNLNFLEEQAPQIRSPHFLQ